MCGILGLYNLGGQPLDVLDIERATRLIRHRGPDDEGYLLVNRDEKQPIVCGGEDSDPHLRLTPISMHRDEIYHLALGFRRLSILDLSTAGHQPMCSHDRRYWIVFNGEIYNYLELRAELTAQGHSFSSNSDTEVILAAYRQWGKGCLSRFNGMWAFAIWDNLEQTLFLSRDRFGIKPLYYHDNGDTFAFASEIKSLVGNHGLPFRPDDTAIYRYLTTGLLPGQKQGLTFFDNIRSLPPGCLMLVDRQGINIERYWHLAQGDDQSCTSFSECIEQFQELFDSSVQLRLRSDVSIGSCLSGGLDSSAIVSTINLLMSQQGFSNDQLGDIQQTFSAIYDTPGPYNERKFIDLILSELPVQKNFTVPTSEKLRAEIEKMVWHQDEPFPTTSIFAQWCVMQKARQQNVTVLLDGQGADELMGGYRPFAKFLADRMRTRQFGALVDEVKAIQRTSGNAAWKYLLTGVAYAIPGLSGMLYELQTRIQRDSSALAPDFQATNVRVPLLPPPTQTLDEHLRLIFEDSNLPDLLRYEDRNSMAFHIESRVPFLDYRLVDFIFSKAGPWRMKEGWSKYLLRKAMDKRLPQEITWRKDKVGFATPEARWMREWMLDDNLNILNEQPAIGEYINLKTARTQVREWLDYQKDAPPVWRWINLSIWLNQWQPYR